MSGIQQFLFAYISPNVIKIFRQTEFSFLTLFPNMYITNQKINTGLYIKKTGQNQLETQLVTLKALYRHS